MVRLFGSVLTRKKIRVIMAMENPKEAVNAYLSPTIPGNGKKKLEYGRMAARNHRIEKEKSPLVRYLDKAIKTRMEKIRMESITRKPEGCNTGRVSYP